MKRIIIILTSLLFSCSSDNQIHLIFEDVAGISEESQLLINGYQIGQVNQLKLHDNEKTVVTIDLTDDTKLPIDSKFLTEKSNFLGDMSIKVDLGKSETLISNGDTLKGIYSNERTEVEKGIINLVNNIVEITDSILVTPNRSENEFQFDLSKIEVDTKQCSKLNGVWIAEIGGLSFLKTTLEIGNKVVFMDKKQITASGWGSLKYNRAAKFYFTKSSDYQYDYYVDNKGFLNLIQLDYRNDDLSFKTEPETIEQKIGLNWLDNDNIELILNGVKFKLRRV